MKHLPSICLIFLVTQLTDCIEFIDFLSVDCLSMTALLSIIKSLIVYYNR